METPALIEPIPPPENAVMSRRDVQSRYVDDDGKPLTLRTIDRLNLIGQQADVGVPPPWEDPVALGLWWQTYYRSDASKPLPTKPRKLPRWIEAAVGKASPALPPPLPVRPPPVPISSAAEIPESPPVPMGEAGELISALAFARELERTAQAHYNTVKQDPVKEAAARRDWLNTYEKLQQAEERARKAGTSDDLRRDLVAEHLLTLHGRIIRTFIREMTSARGEAMRASNKPEDWASWVRDTVNGICRRLISTKFEEIDPSAVAAAA